MTKYVICERSLHHAHAGSKARDDIRRLLEQEAWQPFEVHPGENKGYFDKLLCVGYTIADWKRLERVVQSGDVVLVQFPLIMYNKVSLYALPSVRRMKAREVRFIMLVHDLESLRGYSFTDFDKQWVAEADMLISHNPRMSKVLREYGATAPIKEIGVFDYLLPTVTPIPPEARHGIVLTASYPAKRMGVKTAMPIWEAKQHCRDLIVVPASYGKYQKYSSYVREIFRDYTDQVESFGLDETWLDITGSLGLFGDPVKIAKEISDRIKRELGITVSIGVSFNKITAKLGSDYKKPDAITVIEPDNYKQIVYPLPVGDLFQ